MANATYTLGTSAVLEIQLKSLKGLDFDCDEQTLHASRRSKREQAIIKTIEVRRREAYTKLIIDYVVCRKTRPK